MDSTAWLRFMAAMSVLVVLCYEVSSLDPAAGVSTPRSGACSGPPMTGLCRASIPKWFYNSNTSECQRFIYGGCGGNDNRHDSREECQRTCVKSRQSESKPNATGSGSGVGGQGGGKNKKPRPTNKPPKTGGRGDSAQTTSIVSTGGLVAVIVGTDVTLRCRALSTADNISLVTWVYYPPQGFQEVLITRGKEISTNYSGRITVQVSDNQSSLKLGKVHQSDRGRYECLDPMTEADGVLFELNVYPIASDDACRTQPMTGSCSAQTSRWFYNATASRCQRFFYGCESTENRYESRPQCERTCLGRPLQQQQQQQQQQQGPTGTGGGRKGGNGGGRRATPPPRAPRSAENSVVIAEKRAAETGDSVSQQDPCRGPADPGLCRGFFPKWFYNEKSRTCESFVYGGCPGSNNNIHETEVDCKRACIRREN